MEGNGISPDFSFNYQCPQFYFFQDVIQDQLCREDVSLFATETAAPCPIYSPHIALLSPHTVSLPGRFVSTDVLSPVHPPRKYTQDGGELCSALCWLLGTWTPAGTQEELSSCQRTKETCLYGTTNHDLIELPNLGTDAWPGFYSILILSVSNGFFWVFLYIIIFSTNIDHFASLYLPAQLPSAPPLRRANAAFCPTVDILSH